MKRTRIDIRVRPEVKDAWQAEADKRGVSLTELVHRRMPPVYYGRGKEKERVR